MDIGRAGVADPALAQLSEQVQSIAAIQQSNAGQDAGQASTIAFVFAGIGALVGVFGIVAALRTNGHGEPKVVYVTAHPGPPSNPPA